MPGGARRELLDNISGVREASGICSLQQVAPLPANRKVNRMAELLRRGLYVVAFNAIEDYLKTRVAEHFDNLSSVSILNFDQLPPGLRRAAVFDAIRNGIQQAGYDKQNELQIIRTVASAVASTDNRQQYSIHEYSVLRSGSNISSEEIKLAIGSLHIKDPWGQMQQLIDMVGNVGTPILARFDSCKLKRNAAAHQGHAIEYSDLIEISDLAIPLCFAFDVIFSAGMTRLANNTATSDSAPKFPVTDDITVRFVSERGGRWCRLKPEQKTAQIFPNKSRCCAARTPTPNSLERGCRFGAAWGDR